MSIYAPTKIVRLARSAPSFIPLFLNAPSVTGPSQSLIHYGILLPPATWCLRVCSTLVELPNLSVGARFPSLPFSIIVESIQLHHEISLSFLFQWLTQSTAPSQGSSQRLGLSPLFAFSMLRPPSGPTRGERPRGWPPNGALSSTICCASSPSSLPSAELLA